MALNRDLLERIKAAILAEPEHFRMDTWTCGTAHCIAGWALKLGGTEQDQIENPTAGPWLQLTRAGDYPGERAGELLGLEPGCDDTLFMQPDFCDQYEKAKTLTEQATIAADRIDLLLTEGR